GRCRHRDATEQRRRQKPLRHHDSHSFLVPRQGPVRTISPGGSHGRRREGSTARPATVAEKGEKVPRRPVDCSRLSGRRERVMIVLETERLALRQFTADDAEALWELERDPE